MWIYRSHTSERRNANRNVGIFRSFSYNVTVLQRHYLALLLSFLRWRPRQRGLEALEMAQQTGPHECFRLSPTERLGDNKATDCRCRCDCRGTSTDDAVVQRNGAGDEETYRFLHRVQLQQLDQHRQMRV